MITTEYFYLFDLPEDSTTRLVFLRRVGAVAKSPLITVFRYKQTDKHIAYYKDKNNNFSKTFLKPQKDGHRKFLISFTRTTRKRSCR